MHPVSVTAATATEMEPRSGADETLERPATTVGGSEYVRGKETSTSVVVPPWRPEVETWPWDTES